MTSIGPRASGRGDRDERIQVVIDETEVVRRHSGEVGWPTVALCAGLVAAYVGVIVGWFAGLVPLWAGFALNAVLTYAFYTVHHDANHKAISGRQARWRWLDTACGSIAAIPLQLSFRGYSGTHLRHHAHTNDPVLDPDAQVNGPMWSLPVKWAMVVVFGVIGALPWGDRLVARLLSKRMPAAKPESSERIKAERRRVRRYSQIGLLLLVASIPLGLFVPAFFLWWMPGRVGILALIVLFQWLPHVPYDNTARFLNTRITTFRGSTWLLLQQDRHLIHHLYPSVPWYRYRAVFREVRPLLEAEGARIEGRDSDSHPRRPIQLRYRPNS
ncbi:fatty acid desaturase [Candidatus Neomicrothrix sp.]|uniref:fatty acid desaturase n=1 Tax=Candidatus Neomicrothrix sp. TaxID=2719034 RepID=UPI002C649337|nr:fatty acid desaturase [Candidatus Microthrix sp.]HMS49746.1 fatty acid desaturase [Candidatus Microthrix sp.]